MESLYIGEGASKSLYPKSQVFQKGRRSVLAGVCGGEFLRKTASPGNGSEVRVWHHHASEKNQGQECLIRPGKQWSYRKS